MRRQPTPLAPRPAAADPGDGAATADVQPDTYTGRVVAAVAIVAVALLLWQLLEVVVLVFGGVVVAAALRALADPLQRTTGLSPRLALAAVVLSLLTAVVLLVLLTGNRAGNEIAGLREAVPEAARAALGRLRELPAGQALLDWLAASSRDFEWSRLARYAGGALGALGTALLMLVIGVYLAAEPLPYYRGLLRLLPLSQRARCDAALQASGHGLSRWLLGQAVAMAVVGLATGIGLAVIGLPMAASLGVIAGLLEFVPFFGPIAAGALIVLLALPHGSDLALQALALCVAIQQFENYLLQPWVQRWAIALPPVLGLVAVLVFAILFGPLGVLFATPLMVVVMILVKRLYVRDVIEAPREP